MKKMILNNWRAKLIALLAAIIVWFMINRNLPQPPDRTQFNFGGTAPELKR